MSSANRVPGGTLVLSEIAIQQQSLRIAATELLAVRKINANSEFCHPKDLPANSHAAMQDTDGCPIR